MQNLNGARITPLQGWIFLFQIVGLSPYATDYKAFSLYMYAIQG